MAAGPKILPDLYKIEPLDGTNYKRWSQKLLLCFEQLEIDYVFTTDLPDEGNPDSEPATPTVPRTSPIPLDEATKKKFEKDNKLARNYLLNNISNPLFDLFVIFESAKVIWTKLEEKPIPEQVHVYENLCAEVLVEGMKMCEILQANVLIENFSPSWSDYRNHLKHKKKDLTLRN